MSQTREEILRKKREAQKLYYQTHKHLWRNYNKLYYERHPEKAIERNRRHAAKPEAKEAKRAYRRICYQRNRNHEVGVNRKWELANPEKVRAHDLVYRAIQRGELTRGPCSKCGTTIRVQAHHEDYSRPLGVTWLCASCHAKTHDKIVNLVGEGGAR